MAIKNFVSPHVHIASLDSASTPQAFVNKELELDTGHIVVTDHGSLEAARDVYDLAHKNGLKPIIGIESYLRDDNDPILQANGIQKNEDGTYEDYAVYSHCTMHVQDFTAFSEMSKILSKRYRTAEKHGAEYKPIFTWDDMQHLGQYNVTACSSCLIGICGRHLVKHGNQKIAEEYYCKMASIVKPGNFYVEVFPHNCDSFYKEAVILEFEDGSRVELRQYNKIATDNHAATERSGGIRADAFARQFEHLDGLVGGKDSIRAYMQNKKWVECPALKIVRATAVAQIMKNECRTWGDGDSKIEVNDGDVQRGVNEFVIRMANKYGHKIILSDDSHFSSKDEHEAQTIKLTASGGGWRMANSHHRLSSQDAWMYFHNRMGISERQFEEWVDNGYEWASKFENFTMPSKPQLPTKFYPSDTLGYLYSLIDKHGRMKDKPEYRNRLEREIELFHRNGTVDLLPYFFVCEEVIDEYVKHNKLPGSGRGSSAGVLISYLLGITHVNPLKYNLSLDRFLTLDRIQTGKYPDIDMDLPDADVIMPKDNPESGYLPQRFGDHFCQISTNSKMHLKQSIKDVFRSRLGKVPQNIELICKHLPATPQGVDDADFVFGYEDNDGNLVAGALETNPTLKEFAEKYPDEWTSVTRLLGLTRQKSRHACFDAGTLIDSNGVVLPISEAKFVGTKPVTTWKAGDKNTVLVALNNGISIICTPDHKFITPYLGEVEAKDLLGVEVNYKAFSKTYGNESISLEEAFFLGWALNDGSFSHTSKDHYPQCTIYFTPGRDDEPKARIVEFLTEHGVRCTESKDRPDKIYAYLGRIFPRFYQSTYNVDQRLPKYFWSLTLECQKSFMSGLFSANGFVLSTRPRLGIKLASKRLISDIAIWMNSHGISTSATYAGLGRARCYGREIKSNGYGELVIADLRSKQIFSSMICFSQSYKQKRLESIIVRKKHTSNAVSKKKIKCVFIEETGIRPVWDFNEPQENIGHISGVLAHNSGYVIANQPIEEIVPTMPIGGVRCTQYTAPAVEASGLIKFDFLKLNSAKDLGLALKNIHEQRPEIDWTQDFYVDGEKVPGFMAVPHKDKFYSIYDLPNEPEVYNRLVDGDTSSVFQLDTYSALLGLAEFNHYIGQNQSGQQVKAINSIEGLSAFTALDRPGPLDAYVSDGRGGEHNMLVEYSLRARGMGGADRIAYLDKLLEQDYGVIVFQETLTQVFKELSGCSGIEAENFRGHISKKQMKKVSQDKEIFMPKAIEKLGPETAEKIWEMMITFGKYGFCIDGDQELLTETGTIKIQELCCSEEQLSIASWNEKLQQVQYIVPTNKSYMGDKEVIEATLEDGTTIRSTEDHRFLTEFGWKTLKEIIEEDLEILVSDK